MEGGEIMKVYISPSDQVGNLYAYGNTNEAEQCYQIGLILFEFLCCCGCQAKLATQGLTYKERVQESNEWGADIHLCIHTNAGGGDGTVVFCHPHSINNSYVKSVYNEVSDISIGNDDGIVPRNDLYEINHSNGVCVYVECEFHDRVNLAKWIIENKNLIAEAIARGLGYEKEASLPFYIEYVVQVGAFMNPTNAKMVVENLSMVNISAFYYWDNSTNLYKVQAGVFTEEENAKLVINQIKEKTGYDAYYYVRG